MTHQLKLNNGIRLVMEEMPILPVCVDRGLDPGRIDV